MSKQQNIKARIEREFENQRIGAAMRTHLGFGAEELRGALLYAKREERVATIKSQPRVPTTAWILFCFSPHGDTPRIYNPEPGIALSEKDATRAVKHLTRDGFIAWSVKRSIYHW